jgi:hypothetical protein
MGILDASVESIMPPLASIANYFYEIFHAGVFFEITKQFQQEKADRVIGTSQRLVFMRNNGSNKGEVYQGSDKPGQTAGNTAIGMDFDVSSFVNILR